MKTDQPTALPSAGTIAALTEQPQGAAAAAEGADDAPFDFGEFDPKEVSNKGAWMVVKFDDRPTGARIKLRGKYSDVFTKRSDAKIRRQQKKYAKTMEFETTDPSEQRIERAEFLAALTMDWEGVKIGGKETPFSTDAAIAFYLKHVWVADQVDSFIGELGNFKGR